MHKRTLLVLALLLGLSACAPPAKYYWGDYMGSLHSYYLDPKGEAGYEKALADVTSADAKGRKVPPGLFAEYGYEELAHGNVDKAVEMFGREKAAWPESAMFMDKAIANARAGHKSDTPDAQNAPSPPPPPPAPPTS